MREKKLRFVAAFSTTTAAMEMERWCIDNGIPGRLIPTPRQITAECGLIWSAPPDAEAAVLRAAEDGSIELAATYQLVI